jgi:hypothetical protein
MFAVLVVQKTELNYSCKQVILVSKTTEYRPKTRFILPAEMRIIDLCHRCQNGCRAHPSSYVFALFSEGKESGA